MIKDYLIISWVVENYFALLQGKVHGKSSLAICFLGVLEILAWSILGSSFLLNRLVKKISIGIL